jgi:hypothetical protein
MDSQTQSVWLRFGPVSSMGGFTLCGVYRMWSDHNGHVYNVPEATKRLEALSSQITRAAERYARVVVHGDLNLDLDRSGDPLHARKSLLTACWSAQKQPARKRTRRHGHGTPTASTGFNSTREVANPASEVTNPATEVTNPAMDAADSAKEVNNPATEVTNPATDAANSAKEVTIRAADGPDLAMKPTHAVPTQQDLTTCTRVASRTRPPECLRIAPRSLPRSSQVDAKNFSLS